ncbi:21 kDa protein-like [Lycium ferocissimum]|nr:21 kDa protein-like [Lycium ferocissimum]
MKNISRSGDLKPREIGAMQDCLEELNDSIDGLQKSMEEFSMSHGKDDPKFVLEMNDVETWVSAALTDDNTCMDGFDESNMNGQLKTMVRKFILRIAHLASISLTFINHYAAQ